MSKEIWKDVKGYDGLYQVSNLGRVKSLDRYVNSKGDSQQLKKGKVLNMHLKKDGYIGIVLCNYGKQKNFRVHRLVAESFIPNPENKAQVNHIDGIKTNNNFLNLEWATDSENIKHAFKNNLIPKASGSKNPMAKLTKEQVDDIRNNNMLTPNKELSKKFNVSKTCIYRVKNNITWK